MPFLNEHTEKVSASLKVDTPHKVVAFFIGGAGDKESFALGIKPSYIMKNVKSNFDSLLKMNLEEEFHNKFSSYYLGYNEINGKSDIKNNVEDNIDDKINTYVYIIGHSLGGWNGAHLSGKLTENGYKVHLLITLDPVGEGIGIRSISDIPLKYPRSQAGYWINIEATGKQQLDDVIARVGNKWEANEADVSKKCNTNHGSASKMLNDKLLDHNKSVADFIITSIKKVFE